MIGLLDNLSMLIRSFLDLTAYQRAHSMAMQIFELSKAFPNEERYSLTDQIRRSSRSVATNIAEAWGKRRYPAAFVNKLTDSEAECFETQAWLRFAIDCKYLDSKPGQDLMRQYEDSIKAIVYMSNRPQDWCFVKGLDKLPGERRE